MFILIVKKIRLFTYTAMLVLTCLFSAQAHSASKTILVLGDSLSAEYGLARGTGWVSLLEKKLVQNKINAKLINASISGETTSGGLARIQSLLDQHQPHIIIIELGGNDALRGLDLRSSEKNFREMIRLSKAKKAKVLLVAMQIPPNYGKQYTTQFFSLYKKIATDTRSSLVPFFLEGVADKPELFQLDRIHLKAEAHPTMMNNVWGPLQKMLN